jgi:hypothetical protein
VAARQLQLPQLPDEFWTCFQEWTVSDFLRSIAVMASLLERLGLPNSDSSVGPVRRSSAPRTSPYVRLALVNCRRLIFIASRLELVPLGVTQMGSGSMIFSTTLLQPALVFRLLPNHLHPT